MAAIANLLDETLCDIFSLTIQNTRVYPNIFTTGNYFQDCVALIDISRVCRGWRELTLTNPTLWSSLFILAPDHPSAETLRQLAYFAEVCLARSASIPLTLFVNISVEDFRLAHPIILSLVAHEARWSQVALHFTRPLPPTGSQEYTPLHMRWIRDTSGEYEIHLKNPGAGLLREFCFNIASWFTTCSISKPIQGLETLRIAVHEKYEAHFLAKWLPFAPNLTELQIMEDNSYFSVITKGEERWSGGQPFVLPKLRTLTAQPNLLPHLTCPSLEKYVVDHDPVEDTRPLFLSFVERSACPLHTLVISFSSILDTSFMDFDMVRGYLISTITTLVVNHPGALLIDALTPIEGEDSFRFLPALGHLQLRYFDEYHFKSISALITSRWNVPNARRSLKSVTLVRCFDSIPGSLLYPQSAATMDIEEVEEKWQELAREECEAVERHQIVPDRSLKSEPCCYMYVERDAIGIFSSKEMVQISLHIDDGNSAKPAKEKRLDEITNPSKFEETYYF
ncbi:hypothetical protein SCHPADRAFT_931625 [Schizopora paradoxa]|uniref:Uncharacterized protein n=1 Tax=Schizopora paradoxa TaxID=27342 RepID=A0A0H2RA44_9AGAM|nr:hypothetical protein SCHPADRAFT_931625 [Schizopora paradoxa]